jgi:2-polyprenyl-3-methyl-5-hydroxy-6-metoxy-1,4-benzoquinol methylase
MAPAAAYHHYPRPEVVSLVEPAGRSILDIGCAAGAMGELMLKQGAREVVGVELHAEAAAEARGRLTAVHEIDLEHIADLPYADRHFDRMTFADVLEHLRDPAAVLRRLRRYLADDGYIVCSLPNVRHESVLLPLLVNGTFTYVDEGILDRTHLRFFTAFEIARFLEGCGFAIFGTANVNRSPPTPFLDSVAELVNRCGGDARRFREEATIIQYIVKAKPTR